jgi:hypothetical protein
MRFSLDNVLMSPSFTILFPGNNITVLGWKSFYFHHGSFLSPSLEIRSDLSFPLLHDGIHQGWVVPLNLPWISHFFKALMFKISLQAAVERWVVVSCCLFAFCLPALFPKGSDANSSSGAISSNPISDAIAEICPSNMDSLGDAFVDPFSGLVAVRLM